MQGVSTTGNADAAKLRSWSWGSTRDERTVPDVLLRAFDDVATTRPHLRLLLVGPRPRGLDLEGMVANLRASAAVRHLDLLDQDKLALLYRGARAFVTPTTREGFSLPTLEAMRSGCPILTLRRASLGVLETIQERESPAAPSRRYSRSPTAPLQAWPPASEGWPTTTDFAPGWPEAAYAAQQSSRPGTTSYGM